MDPNSLLIGAAAVLGLLGGGAAVGWQLRSGVVQRLTDTVATLTRDLETARDETARLRRASEAVGRRLVEDAAVRRALAGGDMRAARELLFAPDDDDPSAPRVAPGGPAAGAPGAPA